MRGQALPVEEMMKIFLVLLFALGIFVLVMTIGGHLGPMFDEICEQHPEWPWCEGDVTSINYQISKNSAAALACAVNSVAKTEEWDGSFTISTETIHCDEFYEADIENDETSVNCEETGTQMIDIIKIEPDKNANEECQNLYGPNAVATATTGEVEDGLKEYECWIKKLTCTVENFKMPQDVGVIEEWIADFGDPKFLLYWNMFPVDEDTWTYEADWKIHFYIAAISIFPMGKMAYVGLKSFGLRLLTREAIRQTLKKEVAKHVAERLTIKAAHMITKWAALEIVSATAQNIDEASAAMTESVIKKYDPQPNSIVLKVPSVLKSILGKEDTAQFTLVEDLSNKPVMVKWSPEGLTNIKNAHMVSPCNLNEFDVKRSVFECGKFSTNKETDVIFCDDATEKTDTNECLVRCDNFDNSLDEYMGTEFYDLLKDAMKVSERKLYEGVRDSEPYVEKLYLPWNSEHNQIFYLDDLNYDPSRLCGYEGIGGPYGWEWSSCFEANLYKNENHALGLVPVASPTSTVMESGKTYVLHIYYVDEPWDLNDVLIDIYPVELCDSNSEQIIERYQIDRKSLTCDEVNTVTDIVSDIDAIKNLVVDALSEETEHIILFTPSSDIVSGDMVTDVSWGFDFEFGADGKWITADGGSGIGEVERYIGCYKSTDKIYGERVQYSKRRQCFRIISPIEIKLTVFTSGTTEDEKLLFIDVFDEQFNTRFISDGTSDSGKLSIQKVFIDDEEGYQAVFTDDNDDGSWETIIVSPDTFLDQDNFLYNLFSTAKQVVVSDINSNGEPQLIGIKSCCIDGVMIDLSGLDDKKSDDYDTNYCLRSVSTKWILLNWGGRFVGAAGILAAGIFSGGSAWAFMALAAIPVFTQAGTEAVRDYQGKWPR